MISQDVAVGAREVGYTYGVLAFLLVCVAAWLVRERTRAVRAEGLLRAARRYAAGDRSERPAIRGPDELGVLADAVEQMGAQLRALGNAVRDRQEWFRMLLEHGSDLILTLDRQWRIGYTGPSLSRVLGWTPEQVLRHPLAEFLHPDDVDAVRAVLELTVARTGAAEPIAFRFRHADGEWRSLEAVGSHSHAWSGPEYVVLSARDITHRERLEASLRQAHKMEALGRFAGGVAHDFDHLLTAIQGYASLLLLDLGPLDPRREELEEIVRASQRAAALTRQILEFSRGIQGEAEPTDLNTVVENLERALPRLIGEDVALVTVLDPALRLVHADAGQLEQLIVNLVVNAREAMPAGGRLTLETTNERVTETDHRVGPELPPGWYAVLTVTDTGRGIPPDILPRIFDPFFTTKAPDEGAGLGLATVYAIVKQAGGHIEVESTPGRGAAFRVFLPELPAAAPLPASRIQLFPRSDEGAGTILLVEGEEAVRVFATRALEQQGYRVLEARHGREALAHLAQHGDRVRLIVTDLVMPEMNGTELARRVAAARPGLRVLYLASGEDGDPAVLGLSNGTAYLRKPFTTEGLARAVREALGG